MAAWTRVSVFACVALLAAGCGGGSGGGRGGGDGGSNRSFADQSAKNIYQAAAHHMLDLKGVRVTGVTNSGDKQVTVDVRTDRHGDCRGTITIGMGSALLMASGNRAWIKPDTTFWTEQLGGGYSDFEQIGGKWIAIPRSSGPDSVCDLDRLVDFDSVVADGPSSSPSEVGTEQVAGRDAVRIETPDGDRTLVTWVATAEPHYVLKAALTDQAGGDLFAVTFSEFDQPVAVQAPAPSELAKVPGA